MELLFSKELYPKSALIKAAYSFTDKAYIHLDQNDKNYIVSISLKNDTEIFNVQEFENEMLFQTARYEIYRQTKSIRELIVARAMASTIVDENESQVVESEENFDVKNILTDWFDSNE